VQLGPFGLLPGPVWTLPIHAGPLVVPSPPAASSPLPPSQWEPAGTPAFRHV